MSGHKAWSGQGREEFVARADKHRSSPSRSCLMTATEQYDLVLVLCELSSLHQFHGLTFISALYRWRVCVPAEGSAMMKAMQELCCSLSAVCSTYEANYIPHARHKSWHQKECISAIKGSKHASCLCLREGTSPCHALCRSHALIVSSNDACKQCRRQTHKQQ